MITKFHIFENKDNKSWFFHSTKKDYLVDIVKHGLLPNDNRKTNWKGEFGDWSRGKIFVADNISSAIFYGKIINNEAYFYPILRVLIDKNELTKDTEAIGDWYSTKPIKGEFEIYNFKRPYHSDKNWKKLTLDLAEEIVAGEWDNISEGLTMTAPTKKSVKILKRKFPDYYIGILPDGEIEISAGRKDYIDDFTSIEQICKPLGWYISHGVDGGSYFKYGNNDFYEHNYDEIILKPKFDPKEFFSKPTITYHVSPKRSVDKILRIGLVPKHRDKTTHHPDRVYLTDELELAWGLKKQFERMSGLEYEILKVDMKNLNIKLYSDIDSRTFGYYTLENIPPKNISILPKEEYRKHWKGTMWEKD